jgi:hypothetical protein
MPPIEADLDALRLTSAPKGPSNLLLILKTSQECRTANARCFLISFVFFARQSDEGANEFGEP